VPRRDAVSAMRTTWPALSGLLVAASCATIEPLPPDPYETGEREPVASLRPGMEAEPAIGDEIVVCGQRFSTGAPVVLWSDPGGYDGYDTRVAPGTAPEYADALSGRRYRPGRRARPARGIPVVPGLCEDVELLARSIDQFVLHYDVCGTSRTCFDVLHHQRGLSVHFLLDLDGTLYQTLDLRETAWHSTKANDRSIGIEIAQIGARPPEEAALLREWYPQDELGPYVELPARLGDGGLRTQPFRGRPARSQLLEGRINGTRLLQYDFTREQYESLARLTDTLCRVLPLIEARVPRDAGGGVPTGCLPDAEYEAFSGILGHYHVQANKLDPGPAFDWEGFTRRLRLMRHESGARIGAEEGRARPRGEPSESARQTATGSLGAP